MTIMPTPRHPSTPLGPALTARSPPPRAAHKGGMGDKRAGFPPHGEWPASSGQIFLWLGGWEMAHPCSPGGLRLWISKLWSSSHHYPRLPLGPRASTHTPSIPGYILGECRRCLSVDESRLVTQSRIYSILLLWFLAREGGYRTSLRDREAGSKGS